MDSIDVPRLRDDQFKKVNEEKLAIQLEFKTLIYSKNKKAYFIGPRSKNRLVSAIQKY